MKKLFTPKVNFSLFLLCLIIIAGLFGFRVGTQDWYGAGFYGGLLILAAIISAGESMLKVTVNEESFEKEDLVQAMQIFNKDFIEDPLSFNSEIDGSREYAEGQADYILSIIKSRRK